MQRQIWDLKPRYPRWRRVRGDGNCYYRAVMFGLCLQCLVDPQRMKKLKALVRKTTSLPRKTDRQTLAVRHAAFHLRRGGN